jgi:hypothetical protein
MKKTILSLLILCSIASFAQSDRYAPAMKKNIGLLDSAMQKGNTKELANNFERIGDAEKTQWLPYYYAAYSQILTTYTEKDKSKIDPIADKAEELITKAETLAGKENSEIAVIKSMIATAHMGVDPQSRYMNYMAAINSNIEKAKTLDPDNPRPVYLEGQLKFYTPEAFGGGKAVAKPLFEKALAMFDSFKPESDLHPSWGKAATQYFLSMASK